MSKEKEKEIVFLDTETTGLNVFKEDVMELAIISLKNKGKKSYLFNKLLKPKVKCSSGAFNCHHITNEMVANEKHLIDYYDELKEILKDKLVVIYNSDYDKSLINSICERYGKEPLINDTYCLMEYYAVRNGDYNEYHQSYSWVKLTTAYYNEKENMKMPKCDEVNIKAHRALGDCLMSKYIYIACKKDLQGSK